MPLHRLTLAVVVLFLFAAGAQALDPCTLVSKAELQLTIGQAVAGPTPNKSNAAVCDFKVGDLGALGFSALRQRPGEAPDRIIAELEKRNIAATEAKQKAIAEALMQRALAKLQKVVAAPAGGLAATRAAPA